MFEIYTLRVQNGPSTPSKKVRAGVVLGEVPDHVVFGPLVTNVKHELTGEVRELHIENRHISGSTSMLFGHAHMTSLLIY